LRGRAVGSSKVAAEQGAQKTLPEQQRAEGEQERARREQKGASGEQEGARSEQKGRSEPLAGEQGGGRLVRIGSRGRLQLGTDYL